MNKTYFKYILALLMFGSNGIVANFIDLSSYETVLFRTLLGSSYLIRGNQKRKEKHNPDGIGG